MPHLVSEYLRVAPIRLEHFPDLKEKSCLDSSIPAGSKLLRSEKRGGKTVLIYRSFQQFLEAASYLSHPFDECRHVPDHLTRSFFQLLVRGPSDVAAFRAKTLRRWTEQAEKLADAEKELHSRMPESVLRVMQGKGLLLLREISHEIGWPDTGLFDELCQGFRITGVGTQSNVFKPGVRVCPLSMSVGADGRGQIANFLRPPILGDLGEAAPLKGGCLVRAVARDH